ncbi:hypothetical protein EC973_003963 [Apophysomyces ossiformis]|uniref:alpha-galactosidase n=1 Tax=Apophysomyces ossiformis TaxID=679940 RepID=A0A8H7EMR9_9FUNG|nr:hypothetical protein EC973_003963 [Apophysomyces ossiformis]
MFYIIAFVVMATAQNYDTLVAGQVVYAFGNSGCAVLGPIVIGDMTTVVNRGLFQASYNIPSLISMFASTYVAGALLKRDLWRWIYGMNPILLTSASVPLLIGLWHVQSKIRRAGGVDHHGSSSTGKKDTQWEKAVWLAKEIDLVGSLLLVAGLSLVLFPLVLAVPRLGGWRSGITLGTLFCGAIAWLLFGLWEYKMATKPIIPLSRWKSSNPMWGMMAVLTMTMIASANWQYFTTYLQVSRRISPEKAVLLERGYSVAYIFAQVFVGYLMKRYRVWRPFVWIGVSLLVLGVGLMIPARLPTSSDAFVAISQTIAGIGAGMLDMPLMVAVQSSVPHTDLAIVTSLFQVAGSLGGSFGSTMAGAIWNAMLPAKFEKYVPGEYDYYKIVQSLEYALALPEDQYQGVVKSYGEVQKTLSIIAVCMSFVTLLLSTPLQTFGLVEEDVNVQLKKVMLLKPGITKHPHHPTWFLASENATYVIGVTGEGYLLNLHWGGALHSVDDMPHRALLNPGRSSQDPSLTEAKEEYPAFGGLRYGLIGLKAEIPHAKTRELDLIWTGDHEQPNPYHLKLNMKDKQYEGLIIELHYILHQSRDIITRYVRIVNHSKNMIHLEQAFSAVWHLPPVHCDRMLATLAGAWSAETQLQMHSLRPGIERLESKRGIPSQQAYPWLAIQQENEVFFGTLAWSGSWSIDVRTNIEGQTSIAGGIHYHDFGWSLEAGETFETPAFVMGYTPHGLSGARECLTRYLDKPRQYNPVLYNSWEATGFSVSFENQTRLAQTAQSLGVELFVLDDGWFHGRHDDHSGLGDWDPDTDKFPNGLKPLADEVHALGMKFGLWFEPEMVNPDSDLYRAHPDWVYQFPGRPQSLSRHQVVLDMTRQDVEEFLFQKICKMIREVGIDYIKWDMNRPISEAGMTNCPAHRDPREVWVRHVWTFYRMIRNLKREFPALLIESCSSGGGRADMEALALTDQCWTSDNTNPVARLLIQYGASHVLPPCSMGCWVTDMPNDDPRMQLPLSFRFHVSFMGTLGLGGNLNQYTAEQLEEAKEWVRLYKLMRPVLQGGDLDWLIPPSITGTAATQTTINSSEAVILVFRQHSPFWQPFPLVRLRHLHPSKTYHVQLWYHDPKQAESQYISGACLMNKGLELPQLNRLSYSSAVIWLMEE